MLVTKTSVISGVTRSMELDITQSDIDAWEFGTLVQDAFPNLSPDEREFIMTGSTKEEWDQLYSEEEEEEEEYTDDPEEDWIDEDL